MSRCAVAASAITLRDRRQAMKPHNPEETAVVLTGATSGIGEAAARLLAPRTSCLYVHGPERPTEIGGLLE